MQWQAAEELEISTCTCESNAPDIFRSGVALTRLYTAQVCELFNWVDSVTIVYSVQCYHQLHKWDQTSRIQWTAG